MHPTPEELDSFSDVVQDWTHCLFLMAYSDESDRRKNEGGRPLAHRAGPGEDWADVLPWSRVPTRARAEGRRAFLRVLARVGVEPMRAAARTWEDNASRSPRGGGFGHVLAMTFLSSGVSVTDDLPPGSAALAALDVFKRALPRGEVYFDRGSFQSTF